jgi:plasmid stabilization system protein ParE
MLHVRFLTLAETEVDDAVFWYQKRSADQSLKFLAELDRALNVVLTYPFIAAEIEPNIHRFLLRGFPYSLIYGVDDDLIIVIAVAHQSREPRYWADRILDR